MIRLEARFHPPGQPDGNYIVVAHVMWPDLCGAGAPTVEPSPLLALAPAPATILATLRHLVKRVARSLEHLASLRTPFWSFVTLESAAKDATPETQRS